MAGRRARFEKLAMPVVDSLYRQAMKLTNNPDDAQDLVQDTFERGFKAFDSFKEGTHEIYTGILKSNREAIGVIVLREDKSQLPDTVKTADDYAELTRSATVQSGRTIDEIKHDGDIPYYEYTFRSELNYRYYTAHFESKDAFWGVQFFCAKNRYDKNFAVFSEWAHAITFAD